MRRIAAWLLMVGLPVALAFVLMALVPHAGHTAPPPPRAFVHPQVWREVHEGGDATFIVYLREQPRWEHVRGRVASLDRVARRRAVVGMLRDLADRTQPPLLTFLAKAGVRAHVREVQRLWIVNALVVRGDEKALMLLAEHPAVARILPNRVHHLPDALQRPPLSPQAWHLVQIAADRVHRELGITGRGVVVANMDTGVDWTHPALSATYRGKNGQHDYNWFDVTGTYPTAPGDGHGHGTFTMGLMVGRATETVQVGVAPGATWIAVKVFADNGTTTDAQLHQGFQWILAPTDLHGNNPDPARAPDIVSNSWGSDNGGDETFLPDVMAWRAAGIIPVFAAGNNGQVGPGSVGTPGAFASVIAVGAVDANGLVADFSGRGPAPTGLLKPDVTAPGVDVYSTVPNGYAYGSGTSFSTPIVAGVLALMREARPDLDFEGLYHLLTRTSDDFGTPGPDNDYGWGRVNAYAAVRAAQDAGALSGHVWDVEGRPVPGATVTGISVADPSLTFVGTTGDDGAYRVTVPTGTYTLTVRAFGHAVATVPDVDVPAGLSVVQDVRLTPLEHFPLTVVVTATGHVITDALVALEGTPVQLMRATDPETGRYVLRAPPGTYTLTVRAEGFRIARRTVRVPDEREVTATLQPAPRILLVNGDGWAGDNVVFFYRRLLDRAGFLFDSWNVEDETTIPTLADLTPYDVVILAHPVGSPGWYEQEFNVNFWETLRAYVAQGGRVLLSGPDIGYWEDLGVSTGGRAALANLFGAVYLFDKSNALQVHGVAGEIAEGITLTLNALLAYKNQFETDVIRAEGDGVLIQVYDVGPPNGAATRREHGPERTVYLAYGLEGVGPADGATLIGRLIEWLTEPTISIVAGSASVSLGQTFPVTVTVHNMTSVPWPRVSVFVVAPPALQPVGGPAAWMVDLPARGVYTLTARYRLAQPLPGGTPLRLLARAFAAGRTFTATTALTAFGPNLEASTIDAPVAILPRGPFTVTYVLVNSEPVTATVTMTAALPPTVVATPLTPTLRLSDDGRLLTWSGVVNPALPGRATYTFSTSDMVGGPTYAWIAPPPSAHVLSLGDDMTSGPLALGFDFPFFGNTYDRMWVSSNGWLALLSPSSSQPINKNLPNPDAPAALIAPFWDDLNPSRGGEITWFADEEKAVVTWTNVPHFPATGSYTFQAVLYRDGRIRFQYERMDGDVDSATVGIQNETGEQALLLVYNAPFVHDHLAVEFLPPQPAIPGRVDLPAALGLTHDVPDNTPLHLTAVIHEASGLLVTRTVSPVVRPADFTASRLDVPPVLPIGGPSTLSLSLQNRGVGTGTVHATVTLPEGVSLVGGDLRRATTLAPGERVTFPLTVTVAPEVAMAAPLTFTLRLTDAAHPPLVRAYAGEAARADVRPFWDLSPGWARFGDRITSTLRLANFGNLTASLSLTQTLPAGVEPVTDALPADVTYDPVAHRMVWQEVLPRTRADYIWEDNRTGTVPFVWREPAGATAVIEEGDDVTVGPLMLGFTFPFYEQAFDRVFVSSNGWLSFTAGDRRDFINRRLPSPFAPPNLLAPWWDDLYVPVTGTVTFWTDGRGLAVVTWDNVTRLGSGEPYTFQVMLDASGIITYQYKSMQGRLTSATIGLQDESGRRGVTVAHDDPTYMADGRAIRFLPPVFQTEWRFPMQVTAPPEVRGPLTLTLTLSLPYTRPLTLARALVVNMADFRTSTAVASAATIALHDRVTVTLLLRNTGVYTGTTSPVMEVPSSLLVVETDGEVVEGGVRWSRDVGPGGEARAYAVLELVDDRPDGTVIPVAVFEPGGWSAKVPLRVVAPDLRASSLEAGPSWLLPGEPVTITVSLVNTGHLAARVTWTLPLPPGVEVDALYASAGSAPVRDSDGLRWEGTVPARSVVRLRATVRARGVLRWTPEATLAAPPRILRLRGPRLWWGRRQWLTLMMK